MRRFLTPIAILLALGFIGVQVASATTDPVTATATVGGHDVAASRASQPIRLEPGQPADIEIVVTNHGDVPVDVRQVQLEGRVLGLVFYSYVSSVDLSVAPHATDTVKYRLSLTGLKGQATGLMRGDVSVGDANGNRIASIPMVSDVRGSLFSVYGLFGLALLVLTILALVDAALAVARHRLSANRWMRGLRLLTPGIGIGLVLLFTASVLRLWAASTGAWLMIAGLTAALFFVFGYLTPTPVGEEPDDDDDIDVDSLSNVETQNLSSLDDAPSPRDGRPD
jgi:hypothetical protein